MQGHDLYKEKNAILYPYSVGVNVLSRSQFVKDLGVSFDTGLAFVDHVAGIVKQAYKLLGFVVRCSGSFSNICALKALYYAYVRSRLEYGSIIWSPFYEVHKCTIERIQRKFCKYLYFKVHRAYPPRGYSSQLLYSEFELVSLEQRRTKAGQIFLYKLVNRGIDCAALRDQIVLREQRESSRHALAFLCPQARTNALVKSPLYVVMNSFNHLSGDISLFRCSMSEYLGSLGLL